MGLWRSVLALIVLMGAALAEAARTGEILAVEGERIRFHAGEIALETGEELRVVNSHGGSNVFIKVVSVDGAQAVGEIERVVIRPFESFERIRPGHLVLLEPDRASLLGFGFQLGANTSAEVAGYRGQYNLGMWAGGSFREGLWWLLRLHADDMGEVSSIKHRRSSYMAGLGYEVGAWRFEGHLGLIDSMTMIEDQGAVGRVDPVTGRTINALGVANDNEFGGMIVVSRRFELRSIDRSRPVGWSISPTFSYGNTFASTPYGAVTSVAVALDFWAD